MRVSKIHYHAIFFLNLDLVFLIVLIFVDGIHILLSYIWNSARNYNIWSRKYIRILESASRCSITMMSNGTEVILYISPPAVRSAASGSGMWCRHTLGCVFCYVPEGLGDQHPLDWALKTQLVEHSVGVWFLPPHICSFPLLLLVCWLTGELCAALLPAQHGPRCIWEILLLLPVSIHSKEIPIFISVFCSHNIICHVKE